MDERQILVVEEADDGVWVGCNVAGRKEGSWSYYKNRSLLKTVRYVDGVKQGHGYVFDAAGNLLLALEFEGDRIHGRALFFSKAGEHLATYKFIYDKLDRVEHYLLHEESPPKNKTFVPAF
jgi:antitoxin component YwqK of YwqJK toxin-antitoxin module